MKKVIFIDWNKTLSYDLFWGQLKDEAHPYHKHLDVIEKWLFVDHRDKITPWMLGQLTVGDIVANMADDTGIERELLLEELRKSCEIMTFCIASIEDLVRDIRARDIKVVIATDNMDTFTKFTVPALRLDKLFDGILNSHYVGHLKDEIKPTDKILFFEEYLEANNLVYDDVILLDDSPDSSGKYKKLGFDRVVITDPDELQKNLEMFAYGK